MDLRTQRRLEDFLRLLDLPYYRLSSRMEIIDPPFKLYLEVFNQRSLVTLVLPLEAKAEAKTEGTALLALLAQCQPERFQGTPLRCFVTELGLTASFSPLPETTVQSWFALYCTLKKVLTAAKQNGQT